MKARHAKRMKNARGAADLAYRARVTEIVRKAVERAYIEVMTRIFVKHYEQYCSFLEADYLTRMVRSAIEECYDAIAKAKAQEKAGHAG